MTWWTRWRRRPPPAAWIVNHPGIMGGSPTIAGTRVLASTIMSEIRSIYESYPSLPDDALGAVEAWAAEIYGPGWRPRVRRGGESRQ